MNSTDKLMDMICRELDEIAEKGEMSAGDLDTVYKLIVSKEKLLRAEEIEEENGYSAAGDWNAAGTYSRYGSGNSYAGRRGQHYVRGHYSRGNGRYSMAEGKEMLRERIMDLMEMDGISSADKATLQMAADRL